jgi:glycosyltransferase domain-containing protein
LARRSDDPAVFSIVMPTRNRPNLVRRALAFLDAQDFRGHLLLVDASDESEFVTPVPRGFRVTHHKPARPGHAWREIADALATLSSRYVQLHHDDDFYFLDEIEGALETLERDPPAATAQGRFLFVQQEADGTVSLASHDRFSYLADTPVERTRQCFQNFGHLAFAVARREDYVDVLHRVHPVLEQGWFDQYAVTLLLAARGRALVADRLYGVRELHAAQHHRQFTDAKAYRHWPMILAAPDFSATYAAFKTCLMDGVAGLSASSVDLGLLSLVDRVARALPEPERGDAEVFHRANQQGSDEHTRVARVVAALRASRRREARG